MSDRRFPKQVCLWLTESQATRLDGLVARAGISRRAYLRHLIDGVVPVDRPPPAYFQMIRELTAIGNNLNQLAHHAHATGLVDEARYRRNVERLDEAIARISEAIELPQRHT